MKFSDVEFHELALAGPCQVARLPAVPKSHQLTGMAAVARELLDRDRTKVIMACGTGKSLMAMWSAQDLKPRRVLVLVPTLVLLKQVHDLWKAESSSGRWGGALRTLCVCSDSSIQSGGTGRESEADDVSLPIDFGACTDPAVVAEFVRTVANESGAVAAIFTTYASAPTVARGLELGDEENAYFDVGIFDESHKLVGDSRKAFAFSLHDENVSITKRIFFTATPKVVRNANDGSSNYAVSSMDDEALFGRTAYYLSFKEAVQRGLIAPYKIIISVIDDALLTSLDIEADGHQMLAVQHVLYEAMQSYGLKKAVTFHSAVAPAKEFARTFTTLPGASQVEAYHVSGCQPMAERELLMQRFALAPISIVTNARCLTEGVDVPSVDMVAFIDPRKSKVDIVQAIGRTMRLSPGKTHGHVLLPLHLEVHQGETLEAALERTDLTIVIDVLRSLFENDDDLHDLFVTESLAGPRKIGAGREDDLAGASLFDAAGTWAPVEVHYPGRRSEVALNTSRLFSALKTKIVKELLGDWYESHAEYAAFMRCHGQEPRNMGDENQLRLNRWGSRNRLTLNGANKRDPRVRALDGIGFNWESKSDGSFDATCAQIAAFMSEHGRVPVTTSVNPNERRLAKRIVWLRQMHREGKLSEDRAKALSAIDGLGFSDEMSIDYKWQLHCLYYMMYVVVDGLEPSNKHLVEVGKRFAAWASAQRRQWRDGALESERIEMLETIPNWTWDRDEVSASFDENRALISAFICEHGHAPIRTGRKPNERQLYKRIDWLRKTHRDGNLAANRVKALLEIDGLCFADDRSKDYRWELNCLDHMMYVVVVGAQPSRTHVIEEAKRLASWGSAQRRHWSDGTLEPERIAIMEAIPGWAWDSENAFSLHHMARLNEVRLFVATNLRRPSSRSNSPDEVSLAFWVNSTRRSAVNGDRQASLAEALEFELAKAPTKRHYPNPKESQYSQRNFDEGLKKLTAFVNTHGRRPERLGDEFEEKQRFNWFVVQRCAAAKHPDGTREARLAAIDAVLAPVSRPRRRH